MCSPSALIRVNYLVMRFLHFRNARGDLQEGHFTLPDATCLSFRAQNRHFCALLPSETPVFGHFEHKIEVFVSERAIFPRFYPLTSTKSAFLCSWMAAASPAVPAEAQQGPPELSTARHEPCGVHLAAVRPAIDCRRRHRRRAHLPPGRGGT